MIDLFRIFINSDLNLEITISAIIIVLIVITLIIWLILKFKVKGNGLTQSIEIVESTLGIGNSTIKIKPNYKDIEIAYKLWVELSTRKIGLPIDFKNDVIYEIYNSWYDFFKITRELIKDIPIAKIRKNRSTRKIISISVDVLNKGLRPHLTLWQAKFRKWYDKKFESSKEHESPQDIQKKFPEYDKLVDNMKEVNQNLINYRNLLEKIYIGR